MNFKQILFISVVIYFSFAVQAEEVNKASELPKPPAEEPSPEARAKAHQRVQKRHKELENKIERGASPHEIGKTKAQLQTDRTESNRQDYHYEKAKKDIQEAEKQ
ncbi:MAG: hypothetical protein AAGB31_15200 [Bdellovibrio sp.]